MTNTTKNRHGVTVCGRCLSAMCETLSVIRTPHNTPCVTVADAEAVMAQAAPKPDPAIVAECWTCWHLSVDGEVIGKSRCQRIEPPSGFGGFAGWKITSAGAYARPTSYFVEDSTSVQVRPMNLNESGIPFNTETHHRAAGHDVRPVADDGGTGGFCCYMQRNLRDGLSHHPDCERT